MTRRQIATPRGTNRSGLIGASIGIALVVWGLPARAQPTEDAASRTRRHVEELASDDYMGRLTGSAGEAKAADYIAGELRRLGAQPLPGQADFQLPFEFTAGVSDAGSALALVGRREAVWAEPTSIQALSFSDVGRIEGSVIFAGYGLTVPESQDFGYDSYATLDVEDKIVLVLRYFPEDADPETRAILSRYAGLRYKALAARQRGARALLVVTGPRSPNAGETIPMTFDTAIAGSGILAASVSAEVAEAMLAAGSDRDLETVQAELDTANPHIAGFDIPDLAVTLDVKVNRETREGHNVVGYLPPAPGAALDKPYVMLGAHYDHLGRGGNGNSLAREAERGAIHNGADDNASGVAAVLDAGARLAALDLRRGILLAFWSGEELGLLGSASFVAEAVVPPEAIAAYLNFDMVGRMRGNRLTLQAVGSSDAWPRLIERANIPVGFDVALQPDPYLPTDVMSLNSVQVPSLAFFTGSHEDYHRPSDDPEKVNYEDLDRVAELGALIARRLATDAAPPTFVKVEQIAPQGDRASLRVFTGTIPDYTSEVEGLRLSGVIEGGPAAAAGLREGDVIVEFGGQSITNIYDYTYALDAVKIGDPITVVFIRAGERRQSVLTPTARR